jgi:hypothetical protein
MSASPGFMNNAIDQLLYGQNAPQASPIPDPSAVIPQDSSQGFGDLPFTQQMGAVTQGLGAFSNLASLYAGFKALSLQKKQFRFARDAWNKNYANQVKDYENTLKDRWAARNASAGARGGNYQSMAQWVGSRALTGTTPASHNQPAGG